MITIGHSSQVSAGEQLTALVGRNPVLTPGEVAHAEHDWLTPYRSRHPFPTYFGCGPDRTGALVDRATSTHIATASSTGLTISTEDAP